MRSSYTLAMLGTALALAACASQPKEAPVPVATAPVTAPRPAPTAPAPAPATNPGPVAGSKADFMAKTTDRVYFALDQYTLTDQSRAALQAQAAWLKQYPSVQVQIEGNCDERGTREYNIALGQRRADSVKSYLASLGVNTTRIDTVSYGKDRPIDPGHSEDAWSANRNAHTNIVSDGIS
ncbi:MAG: peptidoglycan-associated lipoprotein Pal [Alphaproteobacteria bacterium]|nr:peptidoglycan-associated lipoprotein Pal [Alphaproteobacteria bacterium]